MAFTHNFTDVHGLTHTAAIMTMSNIQRNDNKNTELTLNGDTYQSNSNRTDSIYYKVVYWPDAAKKVANALPIEYVHSDNNREFYSDVTSDASGDTDALVLLAETHFKTAILQIDAD